MAKNHAQPLSRSVLPAGLQRFPLSEQTSFNRPQENQVLAVNQCHTATQLSCNRNGGYFTVTEYCPIPVSALPTSVLDHIFQDIPGQRSWSDSILWVFSLVSSKTGDKRKCYSQLLQQDRIYTMRSHSFQFPFPAIPLSFAQSEPFGSSFWNRPLSFSTFCEDGHAIEYVTINSRDRFQFQKEQEVTF
jgi:hypothetical protein